MYKLLLAAAVLMHLVSFAQRNIKIAGRVYHESVYQSPAQQKMPGRTLVKKTYPADFKVVLFKAGSLTVDQQYAKVNKQKIRDNDPSFLERFSPQIAYTNQDGSYEFKGLIPNADYILVFCDTQMQMSVISTKSKTNVTYTVKDKKVTL